jgi:hypothetical protein
MQIILEVEQVPHSLFFKADRKPLAALTGGLRNHGLSYVPDVSDLAAFDPLIRLILKYIFTALHLFVH